jgi:hypothetical protein
MTLDPGSDAEREQHVQEAIAVLRKAKQFILIATQHEIADNNEDDQRFDLMVCAEHTMVAYSISTLQKFHIMSLIAPEMMGGKVHWREEEDE